MAKKLTIVSSCPRCGAPIYGRREIAEDEQPVSKKSCACIPEAVWLPTPFPYQPTQPQPLTVGDPPCGISPWAPTCGDGTGGKPPVMPSTTCGTARYEGPPVVAMN